MIYVYHKLLAYLEYVMNTGLENLSAPQKPLFIEPRFRFYGLYAFRERVYSRSMPNVSSPAVFSKHFVITASPVILYQYERDR